MTAVQPHTSFDSASPTTRNIALNRYRDVRFWPIADGRLRPINSASVG